ncbi:MAG: 3-phosphoshikimate 1-carboxyvinyltransferase [Candidatus Polarisedimenticolia bacterium]
MTADRSIVSGRRVAGTVVAPPSKSVTQRALVAAALASGRSVVRRPLLADDPRHLIAALNATGIAASVAGADEEARVEIDGRGGAIPASSASLQVGNAGTAMRFLTAMMALGSGDYLIDGDRRMRERPIEDLLEALRAQGARAESVHGNGCPPIRVGGGLRGGTVRLRGSRSSQYLSALLLAAPAAGAYLRVEIEGPLVSRPYVDLTIDVMGAFGAEARAEPPGPGARRFTVKKGSGYRGRDYTVEGDFSSASYFFAAAAVTGGRVSVEGLDPASRQGDAGLVRLLEEMGCVAERGGDTVTVEGVQDLRGIDADCGAMPDIVQTLAVVALFARGETRVTGVPHLRYKETDRIEALVQEIRRLGGEAEPLSDGLVIRPRPLRGARVETYGDHRMAMAFAVAGLRIPGVLIADPGCVSKSFPGFWPAFDGILS